MLKTLNFSVGRPIGVRAGASLVPCCEKKISSRSLAESTNSGPLSEMAVARTLRCEKSIQVSIEKVHVAVEEPSVHVRFSEKEKSKLASDIGAEGAVLRQKD